MEVTFELPSISGD